MNSSLVCDYILILVQASPSNGLYNDNNPATWVFKYIITVNIKNKKYSTCTSLSFWPCSRPFNRLNVHLHIFRLSSSSSYCIVIINLIHYWNSLTSILNIKTNYNIQYKFHQICPHHSPFWPHTVRNNHRLFTKVRFLLCNWPEIIPVFTCWPLITKTLPL